MVPTRLLAQTRIMMWVASNFLIYMVTSVDLAGSDFQINALIATQFEV